MAYPRFAFRVHGRLDKKTVFRWQTNMHRQDCYPYTVGPDPRTPAQIACRERFAAGVAAWKELTQEVRNDWERKARVRGKNGVNLWLKWFMKYGETASYLVDDQGNYLVDDQGRRLTL